MFVLLLFICVSSFLRTALLCFGIIWILSSLVLPHICGSFWNFISFATSQTNFSYCRGSGEVILSFVNCSILFGDFPISQKSPFWLFWQFTFNLKRTWPNTKLQNCQYFLFHFQAKDILFLHKLGTIYLFGPINLISIFPNFVNTCVLEWHNSTWSLYLSKLWRKTLSYRGPLYSRGPNYPTLDKDTSYIWL